MRTDGRRGLRRPRGAVLRPLGILIAAVAGGVGMWHALMQDPGGGRTVSAQLSRREHRSIEHVRHDPRP